MLASANQNRFRLTGSAIESQAIVTKPTVQSTESSDCRTCISVGVSNTYNCVLSAYCCMPMPNVFAMKLIGDM